MSSLPPPSPAANDTTPPSPMNNNATSPPPTFSAVSPPPPPWNGSTAPTSPPARSPNNTTLVALGTGVGLGGTIVLIAVGIFVFLYKRRNRRHALTGSSMRPPEAPKDEPFGGSYQRWQQSAPPPLPDSMNSSLSSEKTIFTYEELARATENFSNSNLLGQGGFGYVHKGVLPGGKEVAIKQLKVGSGQGEREFQAEVETISRVHHKHLVSLVGYCSSGAKRLLVYEFVRNNTLEFHLHGKGQPPLNWATRMKIALGSARGLAYLHEDCNPRIIHRDIKAANILLDCDFEAKVADFGLARLTSDTESHISTRVMGTFGYLAPEYALTGKLTDKSDVFSFGVMLLELITGRRPIDKGQFFLDDNIVDWARPLLTQALEDGNFNTIVDQRVQQDYDSTEVVRMVACAAVCVRHLARLRPKMSQIVRALEGNLSLDELNEGIRPGHSTVYSLDGSSDYDTVQYKEDLQRFKKMAFETQVENRSDECSGPTSEFGVPPSASSSEGLRSTVDLGSSSEVQQNTNEGEFRRNIPVE